VVHALLKLYLAANVVMRLSHSAGIFLWMLAVVFCDSYNYVLSAHLISTSELVDSIFNGV
jgi:hypothetical protein